MYLQLLRRNISEILCTRACVRTSTYVRSPNPVPGLDRDTYLSPGSVYGEKSLDFGTVF